VARYDRGPLTAPCSLRAKFPEYKRHKTFRSSVDRALSKHLAAHPHDAALFVVDDATSDDADATDDTAVRRAEASAVMNGALLASYSRAAPVAVPHAAPIVVDVDADESADAADAAVAAPRPTGSAIRKRKRALQQRRSAADADADADAKFGRTHVQSVRPDVTFADIGGIDDVLQDIEELVHYPLLHPEIYEHLGVDTPCGVLLHGPSGCGKTQLARAIAGEYNVPFYQIAAPEIVSGMSGESEAKIRDIFEKARSTAPSIIFIDEIDAISPKRDNAQREMERRIVAQLLASMDALQSRSKVDAQRDAIIEAIEGTGVAPVRTKQPLVIVIGATNRADAIDPALRRAGRFDREIAVPIPSEKARGEILRLFARRLRLADDVSIAQLAHLSPGYVGADLQSLTKEAAVAAINRIFGTLTGAEHGDADSSTAAAGNSSSSSSSSGRPPTERERAAALLATRAATSAHLRQRTTPLSAEELEALAITMADFHVALKRVQPSARREGFAVKPNVSWDDVGALEEIRSELEMSLVQPILQRELFEQVGIHSPAGILLFGPPGCGKTLVAKAIANQAGANFISIKGPELLDKYVGESEKAVRQVFARAAAASPCIIFFDELDALCPRRQGDGGNQAGERVVNQLLTEMDGVGERKQIYVVGATNRPDMIDGAMLRPGRLDKLLYVALPDPKGRASILHAATRKTPLAADVDLVRIGADERCGGFSGADLASLVREAAIAALRESFATGVKGVSVAVSARHFDAAFSKVRASVSPADVKRYDALSKSLSSGQNRS
jgi:ribosome biogenesis ATPase